MTQLTPPSSIAPNIQAEIARKLDEVESTHNVQIVFACESGSRAWGFESLDSDYDVRFIYVRPRDWYLSLDVERRRDVIETPLDETWDINGWDLRKALQLFLKTNPPLNEWLSSPIIYRDLEWFGASLRELAPQVYNPISARYHYLRMAANNFRESLRGETVVRKKYLYVLRPLLAVKWIEARRGVVPTEFNRLLTELPAEPALREEVDRLLQLKRAGKEVDRGPPFPTIQNFIEREIESAEKSAFGPVPPSIDLEIINQLFRRVIDKFSPPNAPLDQD